MKFALRKTALATVAWTLLIGTTHGPAQPRLDWFHGQWRGDASIENRPAKASLSFRSAQANTATEMDFTLDAPADEKAPALHIEAHAVFLLRPDGTVTGHWNDNRGNRFQVSGQVKTQSLDSTGLIVELFDGQNQTALVGYGIYANGDLGSGYWVKSGDQLNPLIHGYYRKSN